MTVRIKTQEFTRAGVRMYRVLSIRGVLTKDKLDPIYVGQEPSFWLTPSHKTIKMFSGATISVNGEYKASVFGKLLRGIAVAGDRLHKLNQLKRQASEARARLEKNAAEARRTRAAAVAEDVPVSVKVSGFNPRTRYHMDKKASKKLKKVVKAGASDVPTEFVCVIDRSGSMSPIRDDAIGGFNTFLKEQQKMVGVAKLTMIQFDHEFIDVYTSASLDMVKPLDYSTYDPRGSTALYDAIGRAITTVRERYERPGSESTRVMVVILTDGQENASKQYNKCTITEMIKNCTENLKWAFLYLSASPSAFSDAFSIGLNQTNTISFGHNSGGANAAATAYSCAAQDFRNTGIIGAAMSYAARADPSGKHLKTYQ